MFLRVGFAQTCIAVGSLLTLLCASSVVDGQQSRSARNSTKKIRIKPDALAARAGSAVNWTADFDRAAQKSRQTGKPIFWYVPTIRGTFMDRKPVIDRYMMSGLFSYPEFIKVLNEEFIPIKAVPTRQQQSQFGLLPYKFVEPGFLVLADTNTVRLKIDRITTQHPIWFAHRFKQVIPTLDIGEFNQRFRFENIRKRPNVEDWTARVDPSAITDVAYQTLFSGMAEFRSGNHESARNIWRSMSKQAPDHPLSWKAAAEAQGIGPFVRGFEVFTELPESSLEAGTRSAGSAAPAGTFSVDELWKRGTHFLSGMQNDQGGYVDCDYDFGGTDSLPNVHVAVTALVGMALIDAARLYPQFRSKEVDRNIEKCFQFVCDEGNLNRVDRDEILWADAYRIRFLCRYQNAKGRDVTRQIQAAATALENLQSKRGTWYHEYQNPFVTATALIALHDAKASGANIDQAKVDKGLAALVNDRFQNGSFPYYSKGNRSMAAEGSVPGSAGRMPICELALLRWGKSDEARLVTAINKSFEYHKHLNVALKYDNHTSTMGYGGFFFWYDMRSRTEAITAITDPGLRDRFLQQQMEIVLSLPEIDGCFVDSHELGRCYGTAMALQCLAVSQGSGGN